MKQVVLLSGKGGTGKTSLAAALVRLAAPVVAVDADVDAANLALLLPGTDADEHPFVAGRRARIDPDLCIGCMQCVPTCPFDAIAESPDGAAVVDPLACEGCGVCATVCHDDAIRFHEHQAGVWTLRDTAWGPLVHATLGVGEDNSGKLVALVRQEGARTAQEHDLDLVIVDGPPGIGCPVHAAVTGTDLVLAVTEPGVAAAHDLDRLLQLARTFKVPAALVLNKADLHPEAAARVRAFAAEANVPIVAEIPFFEAVPRGLAHGRSLVEIDALRPVLGRALDAIRAVLA